MKQSGKVGRAQIHCFGKLIQGNLRMQIIVNIIHADNSQFDYQNILELTIYQIKNTFNMYRQKENYNLFMKYKTSGQFKIDDNVNHWFFNN